jgi:hypothetical protein
VQAPADAGTQTTYRELHRTVRAAVGQWASDQVPQLEVASDEDALREVFSGRAGAAADGLSGHLHRGAEDYRVAAQPTSLVPALIGLPEFGIRCELDVAVPEPRRERAGNARKSI